MTAIGTDRPGPGVAEVRALALRSLAIRDRLPAEPMAVRGTLQRIARALGAVGLRADDVAAAELVLAEVLNNVVEHAFAERDDGYVEISVQFKCGGLACEVRDDGAPMPGGVVPAPRLPDAESAGALPEGGFGWFLIHSLTCDLRYRRDGSSNVLGFVLPLAD